MVEVLRYIEVDYFPGLKRRLAQWLHSTKLDLEYEEFLPKGKLVVPGCNDEISKYICHAVKLWFREKGYSLEMIFVSTVRLVLRISILGQNGSHPIITVPETSQSICEGNLEENDSIVYIENEETCIHENGEKFLSFPFIPYARWLYSKLNNRD